jgi:hypothetical protein
MSHEHANPKIERLLEEIRRYLAAVDAFRREGHEPRWQAESNGNGLTAA